MPFHKKTVSQIFVSLIKITSLLHSLQLTSAFQSSSNIFSLNQFDKSLWMVNLNMQIVLQKKIFNFFRVFFYQSLHLFQGQSNTDFYKLGQMFKLFLKHEKLLLNLSILKTNTIQMILWRLKIYQKYCSHKVPSALMI